MGLNNMEFHSINYAQRQQENECTTPKNPLGAFTIIFLAIGLPLIVLGPLNHDNFLKSQNYTDTSCTLYGGDIIETSTFDPPKYETRTYWTVSMNVTFIYNEQTLLGYLERNSSLPTPDQAKQILASLKSGAVEPCVYQNYYVYSESWTYLYSTNPYSGDESVFIPYVVAGSIFLAAASACLGLLIYTLSKRRY